MRAVVIGGSGFIGSYVVKRLQMRAHDVEIIPSRAIRAVHCDVAIHMFAMNEQHARIFAELFRGRLIAVSSGDVYRAYGRLARTEQCEIATQPLTEDSPLRSILGTDYEKITVERVVMDAGPDNCVLRLPAVYGPGDPRCRADPWFNDAVIGRNYAEWRWTHGHVEDVAEAISMAAEDPRSAGRIYNIGEEITPPMRQRYRRAVQLVEDTLPYDFNQHMIMDTTRIRQELGFKNVSSSY